MQAEDPSGWTVEISPDGLEAAVLVQAAAPDQAAVRAALAAAGVKYGIEEQACVTVTGAQGPTRVVVARGTVPVPPRDATVELLFSSEEKVPVSYENGDQVDVRQRFTFTSVEAGEVLARKWPAVPGSAGRTVRGEEIAVRPPRDIVLVSGKGTELSSDGLEVRATSTGRPLANRKGDRVQVYLVSQLLHPRDVDLTTGHLRFKGDVTVGGNVLEGMEVEALGKVEIGGSVTRARVEAGGSVRIGRGVLAGTVVAGGRWGHFRGVIPLMREVAGEASALGAALVQAGGTEAAAPPGVWMRALLESRWPRLTAKLEASIKALRSLPANLLGEEIPSLLGELKSILDSPLRLKDIEAFVRPAGELHSHVTELDALGQEKANIRCGYAVSSTLQATGDIHLTGDGGHSSRLLAGGSVRVERVFRGGEIEAGGDVWVGELGAPGIPARVKVVASASVRLAQVAEDSVIQVGDRVHRALDASRRVGLKLNREGELEFFW